MPVPVDVGSDRAAVARGRACHGDDGTVAAAVERSSARYLLRPKPPAINFARQERLHMIAAILVGPARGTITRRHARQRRHPGIAASIENGGPGKLCRPLPDSTGAVRPTDIGSLPDNARLQPFAHALAISRDATAAAAAIARSAV
jgi:hypothetical protein